MSSKTAAQDSKLGGPSWLAEELETVVHELAHFERPSASEGERRAAEWIAGHIRRLGHSATVEIERAHGGYWWPLGLLNGGVALAGLAAGRSRSRWARVALAGLGGSAAAAIWDEVSGGRLWFRRAALPHRDTFNGGAEAGDSDATETLVGGEQHDAPP